MGKWDLQGKKQKEKKNRKEKVGWVSKSENGDLINIP